jgi:4-hydroxybenzoate polyprenyltransferase
VSFDSAAFHSHSGSSAVLASAVPSSTVLQGLPLRVVSATRVAPAAGVLDLVMAADRLVRLHFMVFTAQLVTFGIAAATVHGRPTPAWPALLGIFTVGLAFHVFAYVFNDVIDLPVDRTQPLRAGDPLVRGDISVNQALILALMMIPLAALLSAALGAGWKAQLVLLASFASMAVYDLWGKRCFCPLLTDLAQGVGWGGLSLWAALVVGGELRATAWLAFGFGAGYIFLINGVHGGLRDLQNDLRTGSRTTAIFLGARPTLEGARMTAGLRAFAVFAQLLLVGLGLAALSLLPMPAWVAVLVVLAEAACFYYLLRVLESEKKTWQDDFRIHLILVLMPPLLVFLPQLDPPLGLALLLACFPPLFLLDTARNIAAKALGRLGLNG